MFGNVADLNMLHFWEIITCDHSGSLSLDLLLNKIEDREMKPMYRRAGTYKAYCALLLVT
jgi:hypothetical protein